ncbi:MAG: zinc ribbon domain-containing protein [Clostridia bacterium]|nr:zinc ribbon domain-containing protein [Clostridia bacterium]
MNSFCPNCGTQILPGANACPNCGTQFVVASKPVGLNAVKAKKRMIFGGVVAGLAFLSFLSFFFGYASGWGISISASSVMGTGYAEATFLLLSFILTLVTLLGGVGAIFKRGLFILTMIVALLDLIFWFLPSITLNGSVGFGFVLHLLTAIATFVVSIVGMSASKVKK